MTEWILTSNLKYYRVDDAFRELPSVEWTQKKSLRNLKVGDICYIYISAPIQEIHWKCEVTEVMRPEPEANDLAYYPFDISPEDVSGPVAVLKALYEYDTPELLSYRKLQEHGLKSRLMSPCKVNPELSEYLAEVDHIQNDPERKAEYIQSIPLDELKRLALKYSGKAHGRDITTTTRSYARNEHIADYAKACAKGICQLCGEPAPFEDKKGQAYLESHHVIWLSKGGEDSVTNTVALCPNCHKKMHILNKPEDVEFLKKKAEQNR